MKVAVITLVIILLLALGGGAFYYLNKNKSAVSTSSTSQTTTSTPIPVTEDETVVDEPTNFVDSEDVIHEDWVTYTNSEYGFEISYPASYQALDDEENLYGWPNAVVLIYGGGQSYDLPIEVWDTTSEYEEAHKAQLDDLTVKQVGTKYITLLNMNKSEEVDEIISTFTPLE